MHATLRLWGRPELVVGDKATRFVPERRFQLLARLALQRGRPRSRDGGPGALRMPQR